MSNKSKVLVTGGAGFIGSNLVEELLKQNYQVIVLDNLSTGFIDNLKPFLNEIEFFEGDIRDFSLCQNAFKGVDYVLHQAALGSVPRSINDPLTSNEVNVSGTLNVFHAARQTNVKRVIYAASSSTYGDSASLPKVEDKIGNPLSPYAVTKLVNELYAQVFFNVYGLESIGLRYFNVFGPKQSVNGAYAAVIPIFIDSVFNNKAPTINGDGLQSRDFTYVENVVQANLKAITLDKAIGHEVFNIAYGEQTTLNGLFGIIKDLIGSNLSPEYGQDRIGDVKHSLADISKAKKILGYDPQFSVSEGLKKTIDWFQNIQRV